MAFITREIPSRKLKTVIPIPWAEPAPLIVVPPSAFQPPTQFKNEGLNRNLVPQLTLIKQALFPAQPFSAFKSLDQLNNPGIKRHLRLIPELDRYPSAVIPDQPLTAFVPVEKFDNPGLQRHLRLVPEIDRYPPPVIPEQPPTAFLASPYFIRPSRRKLLVVRELNEYPASAATADSVFSVFGEIDPDGQSSRGVINTKGENVEGLIFDTFSVSGTIDATGENVRGKIDSAGQNVEGLI